MTRGLLEKVLSLAAPPAVVASTPWQSSGVQTASQVICAESCLLGGVVLFNTDNGADQVLNVWDSEDATTTNDIELIRVSNVATDEEGVPIMFPSPGIQARNGLYVAVAGDLEYVVYYK